MNDADNIGESVPIILDIETSGLDKFKCGIWQIGAINANYPGLYRYFLDESRIDNGDIIEEGALQVIGKSEKDLRNEKQIQQKNLLENFFKWFEQQNINVVLCQNPQFDVAFIDAKARKYGLKSRIQHRSFDLHTLAQKIYYDIYGKFFIKSENDRLKSDMGLTQILNFCGLPDERIIVKGESVERNGAPHNALDDCKLTGECFFRLMYGKNFFKEYSQYPVPNYLIKIPNIQIK
jgi:DNA polymerase III epsilon subunit-like protein